MCVCGVCVCVCVCVCVWVGGWVLVCVLALARVCGFTGSAVAGPRSGRSTSEEGGVGGGWFSSVWGLVQLFTFTRLAHCACCAMRLCEVPASEPSFGVSCPSQRAWGASVVVASGLWFGLLSQSGLGRPGRLTWSAGGGHWLGI